MAIAISHHKPFSRKPPMTHADLRAAASYDPQTGEFRKHLADGGLSKPIGAKEKRGNRVYLRLPASMHRMYAHQAAWLWIAGEWPSQEIDHRDGDGLNNKASNLRIASRPDNAANSKRSSANTSGFKGVSFHRETGKWRAAIWRNYRKHSLGLFETPEEAHAAYCAGSLRLHGEFHRDG